MKTGFRRAILASVCFAPAMVAGYGATRPGFALSRASSAYSPVKDLQLKSPLDDILKAKGFRDAVKDLKPSHFPAVLTVEQPTCTDASKEAAVQVTAFEDARKIAHHKDYGDWNNGYFLAVIDASKSKCGVAEIGLAAGDVAYWIVDVDPTTLHYRSRFVELGSVDGATDGKLIDGGKSWGFSECPQGHDNPVNVADILKRKNVCTVHMDKSITKGISVAQFGKNLLARLPRHLTASPAKRFSDDDNLLWITCDNGCCFADSRQ